MAIQTLTSWLAKLVSYEGKFFNGICKTFENIFIDCKVTHLWYAPSGTNRTWRKFSLFLVTVFLCFVLLVIIYYVDDKYEGYP